MKKLLLLLLVSCTAFHSYSQIIFEKGYYINNNNQKIDCLIKNVDWKDNPTEFDYKLSEQGEEKKETIQSVKEFGIYDVSKYQRYNVKIDRSSEDVNKMDYEREAIFEEEVLLLKVLVEGKANLYIYEEGNLRRFFYKKDNPVVEQLVYKGYKVLAEDGISKVGRNNQFKQQLWNDLKCSSFGKNKAKYLLYTKKKLVNFFAEYNQCQGQESISFEKKQKKDLFNLGIRPGLKYSSLDIQNNLFADQSTDFGNKTGFRFGIEAEIIMPFNKNKWAFLIEPTYQSFKSEKEGIRFIVNVDYTSIELPLGIRHYFFLNENSQFFLNGSVILDFGTNSIIDFDRGNDLVIGARPNFAFGIGYRQNQRFSLELRHQTNREILNRFTFWNSSYGTSSIIFGYSLF